MRLKKVSIATKQQQNDTNIKGGQRVKVSDIKKENYVGVGI